MLNPHLALSLYQIGAIQFGEFTLKSGASSTLYLNLRKIISHPSLLKQIGNAMWEKINPHTFQLVCGVPYTALPIATYLSLEHNLPMIIRRKEVKDYGTKQRIEGKFTRGQSCLVIEDVITSGASIRETSEDLIEAGLRVTDVIALIDREAGGVAALQKDFRVHTVLSLSGLLQDLLDAREVAEKDKIAINAFLEERSPHE